MRERNDFRSIRLRWLQGETFVFEYDEIASIDGYTFRMRFQPERVVIDVTARDGGDAFSMIGHAQGS